MDEKKKDYEKEYINYIKRSLYFKYSRDNKIMNTILNEKSKSYKKSIITLCLLPSYEELNNYNFIPHTIINNYNFDLSCKEILITHSPSCNITKKGTLFIEKAISLLQNKYNIKYKRLENMSNEECLLHKQKSTLFIDQCIIGWYGNSLVEAISFGIPSCAYISDYCLKTFKKNYPTLELPIINILPNSDDIYNKIESFILNNSYSELKIKTINYYDKVHSNKNVGKLLNNFYS